MLSILSVGDHTTEFFFSVLDYQFFKQAPSHSDSSEDFNILSELKKRKNQVNQWTLFNGFGLLCCPSEAHKKRTQTVNWEKILRNSANKADCIQTVSA